MMRSTFAIMIALTLAAIGGTAAAADLPAETEARSEIVERLDSILKRLDGIEQRLATLEATNRPLTKWTVDDHGIIRSFDGRPIGYWGIDYPTQREARR